MDLKAFAGVEIKGDGSKREIEAIFRVHNVPDLDGETTTPASFTDGAPVWLSGWGHQVWESGSMPCGKGVLRNSPTETRFIGRYFDTPAGRENFDTLKEMGDSDWSFGFTCRRRGGELNGKDTVYLDSVTVYECSPVLRGAMGPGMTSLVSARSAGRPPGTLRADDLLLVKELAATYHLQRQMERMELMLIRESLRGTA
jgi:hypothetical protein